MDKPGSYYISLVAALLTLLGLNLFFSLCETGFSSLSRTKLKNMATQKPSDKPAHKKRAVRAQLVLTMVETYDKLLSSILIGNTIANIASSALATLLFITLLGEKGVSVATIVLTIFVLLICEISPKTLAKESPELTAMRVAPLLRFFIIIFSPLNYFAVTWKKIIVRIFPVKVDRAVTEDELLTFVEEVRQEGGINPQEEKMIRQVIDFDEITAAEIVTPRIDVAAISEDSSPQEIDKMFADTGFSRLPVFRENIDMITGVILLKDFHHEVINKGRPPSEIIKPVVLVTKTIKISKLLKTLQKRQSHFAVLIDEFGGTLGIVTIEDIVEELVGEIWDEHDEVVEPFRHNPDGTFTVLGSAKFEDMVDYVYTAGICESVPDSIGEVPSTTVGNWIMEKSGVLPRRGEEFTWENLCIRVTRVQRHRVMEVVVSCASGAATAPSAVS